MQSFQSVREQIRQKCYNTSLPYNFLQKILYQHEKREILENPRTNKPLSFVKYATEHSCSETLQQRWGRELTADFCPFCFKFRTGVNALEVLKGLIFSPVNVDTLDYLGTLFMGKILLCEVSFEKELYLDPALVDEQKQYFYRRSNILQPTMQHNYVANDWMRTIQFKTMKDILVVNGQTADIITGVKIILPLNSSVQYRLEHFLARCGLNIVKVGILEVLNANHVYVTVENVTKRDVLVKKNSFCFSLLVTGVQGELLVNELHEDDFDVIEKLCDINNNLAMKEHTNFKADKGKPIAYIKAEEIAFFTTLMTEKERWERRQLLGLQKCATLVSALEMKDKPAVDKFFKRSLKRVKPIDKDLQAVILGLIELYRNYVEEIGVRTAKNLSFVGIFVALDGSSFSFDVRQMFLTTDNKGVNYHRLTFSNFNGEYDESPICYSELYIKDFYPPPNFTPKMLCSQITVDRLEQVRLAIDLCLIYCAQSVDSSFTSPLDGSQSISVVSPKKRVRLDAKPSVREQVTNIVSAHYANVQRKSEYIFYLVVFFNLFVLLLIYVVI